MALVLMPELVGDAEIGGSVQRVLDIYDEHVHHYHSIRTRRPGCDIYNVHLLRLDEQLESAVKKPLLTRTLVQLAHIHMTRGIVHTVLGNVEIARDMYTRSMMVYDSCATGDVFTFARAWVVARMAEHREAQGLHRFAEGYLGQLLEASAQFETAQAVIRGIQGLPFDRTHAAWEAADRPIWTSVRRQLMIRLIRVCAEQNTITKAEKALATFPELARTGFTAQYYDEQLRADYEQCQLMVRGAGNPL